VSGDRQGEPAGAEAREGSSSAEGTTEGATPSGRSPYEIVYSDEHLIVVDKAAGLVVHPARGHREGTLSQLLEPLLAGQEGEGWEAERPGIVHRLDRDTSGLMLVARNPETLRDLQQALSERRIEREYVALVEGRPPSRTGLIDAPIGRDPRVRTRMAIDGVAARAARTRFTLERTLPTTSLLSVLLETGRTHQIRVHMQAIGHPVAGDPEYGKAGLLGLRRQFLHAGRLALEHPVTGQRLELRSELPADLQEALERATTAG
jgi:23S rRNA pseudouridine1911/1915/1917 synthase